MSTTMAGRITVAEKLNTRVGILERDVGEIRASVAGLSSDVKQGFASMTETLARMHDENLTRVATAPKVVSQRVV